MGDVATKDVPSPCLNRSAYGECRGEDQIGASARQDVPSPDLNHSAYDVTVRIKSVLVRDKTYITTKCFGRVVAIRFRKWCEKILESIANSSRLAI